MNADRALRHNSGAALGEGDAEVPVDHIDQRLPALPRQHQVAGADIAVDAVDMHGLQGRDDGGDDGSSQVVACDGLQHRLHHKHMRQWIFADDSGDVPCSRQLYLQQFQLALERGAVEAALGSWHPLVHLGSGEAFVVQRPGAVVQGRVLAHHHHVAERPGTENGDAVDSPERANRHIPVDADDLADAVVVVAGSEEGVQLAHAGPPEWIHDALRAGHLDVAVMAKDAHKHHAPDGEQAHGDLVAKRLCIEQIPRIADRLLDIGRLERDLSLRGDLDLDDGRGVVAGHFGANERVLVGVQDPPMPPPQQIRELVSKAFRLARRRVLEARKVAHGVEALITGSRTGGREAGVACRALGRETLVQCGEDTWVIDFAFRVVVIQTFARLLPCLLDLV
eukprot:m.39602 g.39602  ORF g.39602 m.39602 type:complete len:394 (-) comp5569_c0_seq2:561-1742(-)